LTCVNDAHRATGAAGVRRHHVAAVPTVIRPRESAADKPALTMVRVLRGRIEVQDEGQLIARQAGVLAAR
jgi:hypothetical protein